MAAVGCERRRRLEFGRQFEALLETLARHVAPARRGPLAIGLVELGEHRGLEAPGEPVARQAPELAERRDAEPHAVLPHPLGPARGGERQARERAGERRGGLDRGAGRRAREPQCRPQRRRDRERRRLATRGELGRRAREQRLQAAEQPQAALQLEQQPIGRFEADERREPQRPAGQPLEMACLEADVALGDLERRGERTCGIEREAGAEPEAECCVVAGDEHAPRAVVGDYRAGPAGTGRHDDERQPREPDGEPQLPGYGRAAWLGWGRRECGWRWREQVARPALRRYDAGSAAVCVAHRELRTRARRAPGWGPGPGSSAATGRDRPGSARARAAGSRARPSHGVAAAGTARRVRDRSQRRA